MVRSTLRILSNNLVRKSIAKAVSDHPDIHEVEIGAVIKRVKSRQVVECYINGERMVAKRFSTGDPAGIVNSLVAELAKVSRNMSSGLNKVNICRFAIPEKGLVVLNFAEGSRFDDHIARALPASRQQLMLRAGEWLAAYVNLRRKSVSFRPQKWIDGCAKSVSPSLPAEDADLLAQLRSAMAKHSAAAHGIPVTKAATHGDYTGLNLHVCGEVFTGVDIQKTTHTLLTRDIARFLVWAQLNFPQEDVWYGISSSDRRAFLSSGIISGAESDVVLSFFVADQFHRRIQRMHSNPVLGPRVRQSCKQWLESAFL